MRADLALRIVGPLDALVARGDMHLRNARVTQSIDFLGALQGVGANGVSSQQAGLAIVLAEEGPLATLELDVNVDTAEPISIVSNVMRGSVNVSLHVGGTGALVILDGRVFLEPTRILLPSGTLQMQSGFIQFDEDNPLFPRLEVFGEARLLGYDITVAVSGRYDEPIVDLSSVPPLPKEDLLVLLLTGNLPSGVTGAQAAQALTVYLARDLLKRWADDGLDNEGETLAERLEFVSGRDVSKAGVLTMEATYKLREQLFGERDVVYIAAERDRYEDYNLGLRFVLRLK
jgi:autotransporter translocation and assembly factor TamB